MAEHDGRQAEGRQSPFSLDSVRGAQARHFSQNLASETRLATDEPTPQLPAPKPLRPSTSVPAGLALSPEQLQPERSAATHRRHSVLRRSSACDDLFATRSSGCMARPGAESRLGHCELSPSTDARVAWGLDRPASPQAEGSMPGATSAAAAAQSVFHPKYAAMLAQRQSSEMALAEAQAEEPSSPLSSEPRWESGTLYAARFRPELHKGNASCQCCRDTQVAAHLMNCPFEWRVRRRQRVRRLCLGCQMLIRMDSLTPSRQVFVRR